MCAYPEHVAGWVHCTVLWSDEHVAGRVHCTVLWSDEHAAGRVHCTVLWSDEVAVDISTHTTLGPSAPHAASRTHPHTQPASPHSLGTRPHTQPASPHLLGTRPRSSADLFWRRDVSDAAQSAYSAACDYLELGDRVEIVNARLGVLHEMLDMTRLQQVALHRQAGLGR